MINRFISNDVGRSVLERSHDLKLHLYRCRGRLCGTFELSGEIGADPFDDDDDDADTATLPADDSQFVRELLAEFQRAKGGAP